MSDTEYQGWEWKGTRIRTYGDVGRALEAQESPEEAQGFIAVYLASSNHAYVSVGDISGYYDLATQRWSQFEERP